MTVAQQQQHVFEQKGVESPPWEIDRPLRLLLEQAPDSVFLHGLDGRRAPFLPMFVLFGYATALTRIPADASAAPD